MGGGFERRTIRVFDAKAAKQKAVFLLVFKQNPGEPTEAKPDIARSLLA